MNKLQIKLALSAVILMMKLGFDSDSIAFSQQVLTIDREQFQDSTARHFAEDHYEDSTGTIFARRFFYWKDSGFRDSYYAIVDSLKNTYPFKWITVDTLYFDRDSRGHIYQIKNWRYNDN